MRLSGQWVSERLFLTFIALTLPFIFTFANGAEEIAEPIDIYHPSCLRAFQQLPLSKAGNEAINLEADGSSTLVGNNSIRLRTHWNRYRERYVDHDRSCFFPWQCSDGKNCLRKSTVQFVSNVVGALFREYALDRYEPYCSAFRISEDRIVTAAHCIENISPMHFRLMGDPQRVLKIHVIDSFIGNESSDFEDYAILRIDRPSVPFTLTREQFSLTTLPNQAINIFAISAPVYEINRLEPENWLEAVRYSRLNAASLDSSAKADEKPPPDKCLLYKAPTFTGMSGAPILAIRRPETPEAEPKIFIVGVHIRNGSPPKAGCGHWPEHNVGIRLPTRVLEAASQ